MIGRASILSLAALAMAVEQGCAVSESCGEPPTVLIESDSYVSTGSHTGSGSAPFAHGDELKQMVVDRAAGTVTIRYERDAQEIVEVWRITSSYFMAN
jgi:hypothetical protein